MKGISYDDLMSLTSDILRQELCYPKDKAEITAWTLVEADARGVSSHGVARLAAYQSQQEKGFAFPENEPVVELETPVSLVINGNSCVGPYIADYTMQKVIEKTFQTGCCLATVKNSNHYGMAGLWAEKAALRGLVGMAFTNTLKCCLVTFGKERMLGTNPIAMAIPADEKRNMFLLDMATPVVANGKVQVYDRLAKAMPEGWCVDENGLPLTDATRMNQLTKTNAPMGGHLFLGGQGEIMGGHKGYGLGLLVELLCSGLSLGRASYSTFQNPGSGSGICHFFGAFRLDLFGDAISIKSHISSILNDIRNSAKETGQNRIYIHGEKEREFRENSMKNGIVLDEATEKILDKYKKKLDV